MKWRNVIALMAVLAMSSHAQPPVAGYSRPELVLGTVQDLSGPLAAYGRQLRDGLQMRVEEANEAGGVHGRKLRLAVADSGYDPARAANSARELIQQHAIFAMVGHLGSAHNLAAMPVQFERQVLNFMPLAASREMYEPFHRLKYALLPTYYDQMRIAAPRLFKDHGLRKPCAAFQDDEFGTEHVLGAEAGLKTLRVALVEKVSYARGATDFSTQVARLKAAGCDMVVLGTIIRETVGMIAQARKAGFHPVFVGSNALYTELIPKLGGPAMDGLYAAMTAQHPYLDASEPALSAWAAKYKTRFNEEPSVLAVFGYKIMDTFVRAANKAAAPLGTDSFISAMDTAVFPRDMFGMPELSFGPGKRLGSPYSRLSQLQNGRWRVVSDYVAFSGLKPTLQKDGKWRVESEFFKD